MDSPVLTETKMSQADSTDDFNLSLHSACEVLILRQIKK